MLVDSEDFKKFGEQIKNFSQHNYEKGILPDLSNINMGALQKQQKNSYLADIKRLISNCKISGNFDQCESQLEEYTKKYIDEKFPVSLDTMFNILHSYQMEETMSIIDIPLQSFLLYAELIKQVYFYIQETYIKKQFENIEIAFIHEFIEYSLELLTSIGSLLLGKNYNSVISIYRTFYENYIVFSYLQNHSELQLRFVDHAKLDGLSLRIELSKLRKEDYTEIQNQYKQLLAKYEKGFEQDYGWAPALIGKNKKLRIMFSESDLGETFTYFYNLACEYTHATAFSLTNRADFEYTIGFLFGISEILSKEFQALFKVLQFSNNKEKHLLRHWINVASKNFTDVIKKWYNL